MNREIIERFLNGNCSHTEFEEVIQWLETVKSDKQLEEIIADDLKEQFAANSKVDKNLNHLLPGIFAADSRSSLAESNKEDAKEDQDITADRNATGNIWRILKIAASVVLIVSLSLILFSIHRESKQQMTAEETVHMVTKSNGYGRKSTIFLKDGTVVYLDSDSKITYPSGFKGDKREVTLTGEAFFDVAHSDTRPFIVKAGPVNVLVLGTKFNVRAFTDAREVKVSLEHGQVEVFNDVNKRGISDKLFLSPGQSVVYKLEKERFDNVSTFDPLEDCGWKDGIIYFKKAGFKPVLSKLEKWYNVQFEVVNDPPAVWSYSGKFINQNLDNVLRSIGFSQGFSYKIRNDKVIINFNVIDHVSNP